MLPRKKLRRDPPQSEFFCNVCNKDLKRREKYDAHIAEDHVACTEPGCPFSGPEHVMAVHKLRHTKAADGASVVDSPEELRAWIAARRASFPSKGNLQRKAELEAKRRELGALPEEDRPRRGLLETLLRRQHFLDRGGKGYDGGKGFGKYKGKGWEKGWDKGWEKGKGKFKGKGKGKKGTKGKDGKGKGKGSGKGWGYSWDWYGYGWYGGGGRDRDLGGADAPAPEPHALVAVPLPSMVANCVPLEAPFAQAAAQASWAAAAAMGRRRLRGLCKYFEQGFCFHGDRCQYEHAGRLALMDSSVGGSAPHPAGDRPMGPTVHWWALPSTVANRVGPGDGPPPGRRVPPLRATYVRPTPQLYSRMRRDGLLRRLLRPEVDAYYSAILQCVRYLVDTDFLRLERPARLSAALPAAAPSLAPAAAAAAPAPAAAVQAGIGGGGGRPAPPFGDGMEPADEDFDDVDMEELASVPV